MGAMKSIDVARAGYRGMMWGQTIVIPGTLNKLLAQSVRFGPAQAGNGHLSKCSGKSPVERICNNFGKIFASTAWNQDRIFRQTIA
jgi:hypothetical protein